MSLISEAPDVIEVVSDWAVELIQEVVKALMPDGKPFGHVNLTPEERIAEYVKYHGNQEQWLLWIDDQANQIVERLTEAAISPDDIVAVHPYDIAMKYAIVYSAEMEDLLREHSL